LLAIFFGSGIFGFGSDYYRSYTDIDTGRSFGLTNILSWNLLAIRINEFYLGYYAALFVIFFGVAKFVTFFVDKYISGTPLIFIFVIILLVSSQWSIYMSALNTVRQGIFMGLLYLSLVLLEQEKKIRFFIVSCIGILSHTSSVIMIPLLYVSMFLKRLLSSKYNRLYVVLLGFSLFVVILYLLQFQYFRSIRVIGIDFSGIMAVASIAYALFFIAFRNRAHVAQIFLYLVCVSILSFWIFGLSWRVERVFMVVLVPFVFYSSLFFVASDRLPIIVSSLIALVALTWFSGMYSATY